MQRSYIQHPHPEFFGCQVELNFLYEPLVRLVALEHVRTPKQVTSSNCSVPAASNRQLGVGAMCVLGVGIRLCVALYEWYVYIVCGKYCVCIVVVKC